MPYLANFRPNPQSDSVPKATVVFVRVRNSKARDETSVDATRSNPRWVASASTLGCDTALMTAHRDVAPNLPL